MPVAVSVVSSLTRASLRARGDHRRVVGAVDGDQNVLGRGRALVVRHRHREGFGVALALRQILVAGVGQRVGPHARAGVDRKAAIGAGRVAAVGGRRAVVDVARRHRAGRGQRGVFLDGASLRARGDHRRVVGAVDGDQNVLGRGRALVVRHRHREGFGVALALRQILVAGVGQRVGPHARAGVDRKAAIGAGRVAAVGGRRAVVDVARRHRAGRGQRGVFLDGASLRARGDHRRVVGAVDGDQNVLGRGRALVVRHRHREGFGVALALRQILVAGVGQRVGPHARAGVDRKAAIGAGRVAAVGGRRAVVDVARRHRAGRGQRGVFLDGASLRARGDHRRVVGAVDGDQNVLGRGRALVVRHRHREGFGVALALRQILVAGVGQRVGPHARAGVDRKAAIGAGRVAAVGGRRAVVDVARRHRAGRGQRGVFLDACQPARQR